MKHVALSLVLSLFMVMPALVVTSGCAGKQFTPAQTAKVGTTLIESVRKVQQFTTENVRSGAIPRNIGDRITDTNTKIKASGEAVLSALDVWNAAASGDLRNAEALKVFALISKLELEVAELTGAALPTFELSRNLSQLTSNILVDIEKIKAALRS